MTDTNIAAYDYAISPHDPQWPTTVHPSEIPQLLSYERPTFSDERGFFREAIEKRDLEKVLGKEITITQWNHSQSLPGVIRGFHLEPWEKLIYVPTGEVMSAIVDLRLASPTFGKVATFRLGEKNRKTLYLPKGMGNSYCVLSDTPADYMYLITAYFEGAPTPAVSWNDPMLTKQFGGWPVDHPIVSEKDMHYPTLQEKFGKEVDFSKYSWLT